MVLQDFPLVFAVLGQFLQTDIPLVLLQLHNQHPILPIVKLILHELPQPHNQYVRPHFYGVDEGIVGVNDHEGFLIFGEEFVDILKDFGDFHGVVVLEFENGRGVRTGSVAVSGVALLELVEGFLFFPAGNEPELAFHEVGKVGSELLLLLLRVYVKVDQLHPFHNRVVQKVLHGLRQRLALLFTVLSQLEKLIEFL